MSINRNDFLFNLTLASNAGDSGASFELCKYYENMRRKYWDDVVDGAQIDVLKNYTEALEWRELYKSRCVTQGHPEVLYQLGKSASSKQSRVDYYLRALKSTTSSSLKIIILKELIFQQDVLDERIDTILRTLQLPEETPKIIVAYQRQLQS